MHAAERVGAAAGRAAASEDRFGGYGRAVGAELVLAARESVEAWASDAAPLWIDPAGRSIAAYVERYSAAYDAWMDQYAAQAGRLSSGQPKGRGTTR